MKPFTKTYKKGSYLFHENDHSRELYIIQEGSVDIVHKSGSREILLANMSKGAVIGEMSLIDGKPRSASARAATDVSVVLINADAFHEKIAGVPPWFVSIIRTTSQKIRNANERLEHIHDRNRALSIIVMLGRFFVCYGASSGVSPRLRLGSTRQRLIRIMGVTAERIVQVLEFLASHGLIELDDDQLSLPSLARFESYCDFVRGTQRKIYDGFTQPSPAFCRFLAGLTATYPACIEQTKTVTELTGLEFWATFTQLNLTEDHKPIVEDLKDYEIVKTHRVSEQSGDNPLDGLVFIIDTSSMKKWSLFCAFSTMLPAA